MVNNLGKSNIKKTIYQYDYKDECYYNRLDELSRMFLDYDFTNLNDEVEILDDEEKGLPEKLGLINYSEDQATLLIHHKVDEIIDYLEKQSKGE